MAKKSYLGKLAKGFVRSAVNQVGRDGGRVISNQIYGDAHSTPIRGTGYQQNQYTYDQTDILQFAKVDTPTFWNYVGWILLVMGTCGIGGLILVLRGLYITKKTTVSCYTMNTHEITKTDMRYRKGYRVEGYYQTKQKLELPAEAVTQDMIKQQKDYGKLYMIAGVVVIVLNIALIIFSKYMAPTQ